MKQSNYFKKTNSVNSLNFFNSKSSKMKKNRIKTLIICLSLTAITIYSCEKTNSFETTSLSKSEIRALAKKTGEAHNILIESAARIIDVQSSSSIEYRKAILSIKLSNFSMDVPESKVAFDKYGLNDPETYVHKYFKKIDEHSKNYLVKIFLIAKAGFSQNTLNKIDTKLEQIFNDQDLDQSEKLLLSGTLEISRNSLLYWHDARKNSSNPYHNFFTNVIKSNAGPFIYFDCTTMIDMAMYAISFQDNYYTNALSLETSNQMALLDGAYQSGLASMAGGACAR